MIYLSANVGYPLYVKSKQTAENLLLASPVTSIILLRSGLICGEERPATLWQARLLSSMKKIPIASYFAKKVPTFPLEMVAAQPLQAMENDVYPLLENIKNA